MPLDGESSENIIPVRAEYNAIVQAIKLDPVFCIGFFQAENEDFDLPVPEFHKIAFNFMLNSSVSQLALALPRGHAKSTLAKIAVIWHFLFTKHAFCVYISNTTEVAINYCKDIVAFLETPNFKIIFGEVEWITKRDGEGFYHFKIGEKVCILKAQGAGKQIRGMLLDNKRPDFLVIDDLEDYENTDTEALRKKMKRWVYATLFKALARRRAKKIWLGNMISNHSLLKNICSNPNWTSMVLGAILPDGNPLWPDMWTVEALRADFLEYQKEGLTHLWFAEMLNMPLNEGVGVINADQIKYAPAINPSQVDYAFLTIDPAFSENTWSNDCAIAVHAWNGNAWQSVEHICFKSKMPDDIIRTAVALAYKWRAATIAIETNAAQILFLPLFDIHFKTNNIRGIEVVRVIGRDKKASRISSYCALIVADEFVLTEGDYATTNQLLEYNPAVKDNKDDLIDAHAYAPQVVERYHSKVYRKFNYSTIAGFFPVSTYADI